MDSPQELRPGQSCPAVRRGWRLIDAVAAACAGADPAALVTLYATADLAVPAELAR